MLSKYVLGVDPSGNFYEGKGITGYCLLDCRTLDIIEIGSISASRSHSQIDYWERHLVKFNTICKKYHAALSVEDYKLYAARARNQINSSFETIQLIGIIKYWAYVNNVILKMRLATIAKNRFTDEWLEKHKYIYKKGNAWYCNVKTKPLVDHERDALRHALYFAYFENKE